MKKKQVLLAVFAATSASVLKNGFECDGVITYIIFEPPPLKRFAVSAAFAEDANVEAAITIAIDAQNFDNFIGNSYLSYVINLNIFQIFICLT